MNCVRPTDVEERLKTVVLNHSGRPMPLADLQYGTSLYGQGLGFSSLDLWSLIVAVEEAFGVFFEEEDMFPAIETFGPLLSALQSKLEVVEGADADA